MRRKLIAVTGGLRRGVAFLAAVLVGAIACGIGISRADLQPGLDSRANLGAFLDGSVPSNGTDPMPLLLSQTQAFTDTAARTPHPGLVNYSLNSPLWTDNSEKDRYLGVPYGGATGNPPIGFTTGDYWTFPNGTVIVKNFDLILDERSPGTSRRRMETRILIRYNAGTGPCLYGESSLQNGDCIRGASYKWRPNNLDADLVANDTGELEPVTIIDSTGATRQQNWQFPGPAQCNLCHNQTAGMVLGPNVAQMNRDHAYPNGRVANQLHTLNSLGMFNINIGNAAAYPQYPQMVDVADTSKTMEHRIRSYISSNCSFCHRPGGMGPVYDMRYETPMLATNLISAGGFIRDNLTASRLYVRDAAAPGNAQGIGPMPPLARNVPDARIVGNGVSPGLYSEWVNSAYDVTNAIATSVTELVLTFDRALDPVSAGVAGNYAINGITVLQATAGTGPQANTVTLITSPQAQATTYTVTINRVREQAAPQNPIFPNTTINFQSVSVPGAPSITSAAPGNGSIVLTWNPPLADGGMPITAYQIVCNAGSVSTTAAGSPATITGLANGTAYACTVSATNALGSGAPSAVVAATPRTLPAAPTITSIVGASGSASISFATGSDGGAPITAFEAACTSTVPAATFTASGGVSPLVVNGLANGTEYACTITATNAAGTGSPSTAVTVVPQVVPVLQGVKSVKLHGGDMHGIDIDLVAAIDGGVTVEPRNVGTGHRLVFAFDIPVTAITGVTVTDANGAAAGSAAYFVNANEVTVILNGVADTLRATVALTGVNGNHAYPVSVGFLLGDVTGSRAVNSADIMASKVRRAATVDASNFWLDVDTSGKVDEKDTAIIKAKSGKRL